MDGNFRPYDHIASFDRIDEILAQPQENFSEADSLPDRDKLTFSNGFYAYCTALFVDIRDSSALPSHYKRPRLTRIYRAFISETVAILNSVPGVREVNIVGDCVWAVYNTPRTTDLDDVFALACRVNCLENILNHKLGKAGYERLIYFGVGLSYGRALMVKAGHRGSTINDVVYMGDVVNQAAHLASRGGKRNSWNRAPRIHMDGIFWQNLNDKNQGLTSLVRRYPTELYSSDAVNIAMRDWLYEQRK